MDIVLEKLKLSAAAQFGRWKVDLSDRPLLQTPHAIGS